MGKKRTDKIDWKMAYLGSLKMIDILQTHYQLKDTERRRNSVPCYADSAGVYSGADAQRWCQLDTQVEKLRTKLTKMMGWKQ